MSADAKRIQSILRTMETKKKKIVESDIFGVWSAECAKFLKETLAVLSDDIGETILRGELADEEKQPILEKINPFLEDLLSQIDSITNNACKNSAIHELVSYIFRDLQLSDDARYVICVGGFLLTVPLLRDLSRKFRFGGFFPATSKFLDSEKSEFFAIFIPPLIYEDRAYWPAIAHEIGHIVERLNEIVEPVHHEVNIKQARTLEGRNYFHSREYVSDYIANAYFGSVYVDVAYELLYELKVLQRGTHPLYGARLHFLKKTLPEINSAKTVSEKDLKERYTDIPRIGEVVDGVRNVLIEINKKRAESGNQPIFPYKRDSELEALTITKLKQQVPSLVPPQVLLNAFWPERDQLLTELQERLKKTGKNPSDALDKLAALVDDSIRLTNMKRTYELMVNHQKKKHH